jgi:hypothetical protein
MKDDLLNHHGCELVKGGVGILASLAGVLTSLQENIEYAMRLSSLAIGMVVGILTAVSIVKGWKKKP